MVEQPAKQPAKDLGMLSVLNAVRGAGRVNHLVSRGDVTQRTLDRILSELKSNSVVIKKGYGVWELRSPFIDWQNNDILLFLKSAKQHAKKSSSGMRRPETDLHALNISIPVVSGEIDLLKWGGYESQLRNWSQQFLKVSTLGLTIKNNNGKSIGVFVWSRRIFDPLAIPVICMGAVHAVCKMFKQNGIELEYLGWQVKAIHMMIRQEQLDEILNKGLKVDVALGRAAEKISENDVTREAHAWVDSTPFKGVETDDLTYHRNFILMPENMDKLTKAFQVFMQEFLPVHKEHAVNIKTHTSVLQNIDSSFQKFNSLLEKSALVKPKRKYYKRKNLERFDDSKPEYIG